MRHRDNRQHSEENIICPSIWWLMCNGLGGWKALLGAECTIKNYTRRTLRSVYGYLNVGSKDKCCVYLCGGRCVDTGELWRLMLVSGQYLVTAPLLLSSELMVVTQEADAAPGPISYPGHYLDTLTPATCASTTGHTFDIRNCCRTNIYFQSTIKM